MPPLGKTCTDWPLRHATFEIADAMKRSLDCSSFVGVPYVEMPYMETRSLQPEWKKGSAELLILSLVEARPRHGYEISKLIEHARTAQFVFTLLLSIPCSTDSNIAAGCLDVGSKKMDNAGAATIV